ncbi:MAG: hypothetical protein K8R45_11995 [Desulfobacterales bacterium]|nr:hypothetical protein [Desulfobacterales bacterium]
MKEKKRKKKNKHVAYTRKSTNQQRARFDAYVDAYLNAFVEASFDEIIEALLLSPDGRTSMYCYLPGIEGEIEVELRLDELINHCGCDITALVGACSIH